MKKILSLISALEVCCALTACNSPKETEAKSLEDLEFVHIDADYMSLHNSFDDIEKNSELIVEGRFIDDEKVCYERYSYEDSIQKDVLVEIISSCPMKITKVLSGGTKVGDVVNVVQREGVFMDRFISQSPLTPMQKGDEWIFCLKRTKSENYDGYLCVGGASGRYPAKNSSNNKKTRFSKCSELGVYNKSDYNDEYYNQLVKKYGI